MTYELAKELKDAGFPNLQNKSDDVLLDYAEAIILSELIAACGDSFDKLWVENVLQKRWFATGNVAPGFIGEGETPEEAVARLWLMLNKKT